MNCTQATQTADDAAAAVADAVRSRVLPSLAAFFGQDLRLLACTEAFAAAHAATPVDLCGRRLVDAVGPAFGEQLLEPARRAVAGSTVHTTVERRGRCGSSTPQWLTLVPYVVDGEQLGVAVLTGEGV